jgi:hypothetical protein
MAVLDWPPQQYGNTPFCKIGHNQFPVDSKHFDSSPTDATCCGVNSSSRGPVGSFRSQLHFVQAIRPWPQAIVIWSIVDAQVCGPLAMDKDNGWKRFVAFRQNQTSGKFHVLVVKLDGMLLEPGL